MTDLGKTFLSSGRGKLILALLLAGVAATAGATTYAYFYGSATATVRSPDVTLASGTDASATCVAYPCATVGISTTSDTATVSLSLFKADAAFTPAPSTYYTDLVQVKDSTNPHTILGVSVSAVSSTSPGDFGQVAVYFCSSQCTFGADGNVAGGTVEGSYVFSSATPGVVFSGSQPITAGGTQYVEVVAYAGGGASVGDTISFRVTVQWV